MNAVITKVKFPKRKEHAEIRDRIEQAIVGYDRKEVDRALDQMLTLLQNEVGVNNTVSTTMKEIQAMQQRAHERTQAFLEEAKVKSDLQEKAFKQCAANGKISELADALRNNDWDTVRKLGEE